MFVWEILWWYAMSVLYFVVVCHDGVCAVLVTVACVVE